MASWVTHLMVADEILLRRSAPERRAFCVGNVASDCNEENESFTAFLPPREITHFLSGKSKTEKNAERFFNEYLTEPLPYEKCSFLLGYYAHLLTDAAFVLFLRDENRLKHAFSRLRRHGIPTPNDETWEALKNRIGEKERMAEIYDIEAAYLEHHPWAISQRACL